MFHEYPYSLYFSDIDRMCGLCHKAGYKLEVHGNNLRLVDGKGNVVSDVQISFAEKALYDVDGRAIRSYLVSASTGAQTLILQHGDGTVTTLTLPYATAAKEDVLGKDLTRYTYTLGVSGDDLLITRGDGTTYTITVPFATAAAETVDGTDLTTLAASLVVDGDSIVLKDSKNREISRITVPYAVRALNDGAGDKIESHYGSDLETGTTTVSLKAKDGSILGTITVPFATTSATDTQGNAFLHDYAEHLVIDGDGKRVGVEAHDGTRLNTITIPFATLATDATNALEDVRIVGDTIQLTTHGGTTYTITPNKAVKADRDGLNNVITDTYFASVQNDAATGSITFYDARGQVLASIVPVVAGATYDSEGNEISDYVKSVVADNQSNFVLVTHGDGTVDSVLIQYSVKAWKDSLGQPIQNTYISNITIEEDEDEPGKFYLTGWNGDIPKAKIVEIPLEDLVSGLGALAYKDNVTLTGGTLPSKAADVYVQSTLTYDATEEELTFTPGTFTEGAFNPGAFPTISIT